MSTNLSGSYNLDLTANDLIVEALELLQAVGDGETIDGGIYLKAKNSLNQMLKLWEAQGIHLWMATEYTLFFQKGQRIYDLSLPATRCVDGESWYSTQLSADAAIAATDIVVDSVANMTIGQAIGILTADNNIQWTIIEAINTLTVSLKDALTVAASDNTYVRFYDTKGQGSTTLAVGAVATDVTIELASVVGIAPDDVIGITDDVAAVHWTTVNSVDFDTNEVVINSQITATSSIGVDVIFYESVQNYVPISRIPTTGSMRRHSGEASDYEIPIQLQSREDYMTLPNKTQQGTVIQAFYDRQEPQGKLYVWNAPSTAVEYLNFTAEREIAIIVDSTDTFDLPAEWYLAIAYNLARLLVPKIGCSTERAQIIRAEAQDYLDQALSFDSDIYGMRMVPEQTHG